MHRLLRRTSIMACAVAVVAAAAQSAAPVAEVLPVGIIGKSSGTGGMPAIAEAVASLRGHTLYHPVSMPQRALPLLVWANGGCRDNGLRYSQFLREIASHGLFVISLGHPRYERALQPPGADLAAAADAERPVPRDTGVAPMTAAIDWAESQNRDSRSRFRGRIDTRRVGVMGTSCGGLQAIAASADPRVDTTIGFNTGVLIDLPTASSSDTDRIVLKAGLARLHGAIAYINGGPTDIAYPNAVDDMRRIDHVPVFFAENGVGHGGTYLFDAHGGSYARVAVNWMAWQLKDDARAARWFRGADCVLCTRPGWSVRKKNFHGETSP